MIQQFDTTQLMAEACYGESRAPATMSDKRSSRRVAMMCGRFAKMVLDLGLTLVGLVLLLPVLLVVAAVVSLDGGPVLYKHMRIGRNGTTFPCLKFRSMSVDGDRILADLLVCDPIAAAEWATQRKLTTDPRVTAIGRILRATSLDELPQLFNVLRGEMSLVGPRPIVKDEVSHYGDNISLYYSTRPGLTGLWQVSGRSETTYAQRVRLDSWYATNWSFWLDLEILIKTFPAVLKRSGAR